jgi:hypothetical protein
MLIGHSRQAQVDDLSQRKANLLNDIMQPTAIIPYVSICTGNASEARSRCTLPYKELYRRLSVRLRLPVYLDIVAAPANRPWRVSLGVL